MRLLFESRQAGFNNIQSSKQELFSRVIYGAQQHLLVVGSFLVQGRPDWALLDALKSSAQEEKSLKITIVRTVQLFVNRDEEQQKRSLQEIDNQLNSIKKGAPRRVNIRQTKKSDLSFVISESRACYSSASLLKDESRHDYGFEYDEQFELVTRGQLKQLNEQIHSVLKLIDD